VGDRGTGYTITSEEEARDDVEKVVDLEDPLVQLLSLCRGSRDWFWLYRRIARGLGGVCASGNCRHQPDTPLGYQTAHQLVAGRLSGGSGRVFSLAGFGGGPVRPPLLTAPLP